MQSAIVNYILQLNSIIQKLIRAQLKTKKTPHRDVPPPLPPNSWVFIKSGMLHSAGAHRLLHAVDRLQILFI